MIKGIGIDLVDLEEFRRLCDGFGADGEKDLDAANAFVRRTFTPAELAQACGRHDSCEYLAGRFACKEAVFKALAPLASEGFDLRVVETIDAPTGQPVVTVDTPGFSAVCSEAGVSSVLVSVTNEGGYVEAIALAQ